MKKLMGILVFLVFINGTVCAASNKGVDRPVPTLAVESGPSYWGPAFGEVYRLLLSNLREPNKLFPMRHAIPAKIFMGVYLWDTAFIAQVWKPWDSRLGEEICTAVMEHSVEGRLPHFVSKYDSSEWTQPAVMAWSVWELYQAQPDRAYLEKYYPVLKDYNRWLYENRRLEDGLFFWDHPYESGIDNAPRFSSRSEAEIADMRRLAAIDLSSYLVRQNRTLAAMARELGRDEEAARFERKAEELAALINRDLWDPDTEMYYDLDANTGRLIKVKTIAGFFPLFAGAAAAEQAQALVRHIMDPAEFNTLIPLPSVSRDDPAYEPDMWRGPVWINTAYLVIVGLEDYGYRKEAAELAWKLVDGVYRTWEQDHKIYEFYDPDRIGIQELHRKRGNLYKKITLGDKPRPNFVGWTGLVNTLLIEHLVGLRQSNGRWVLAPNFPAEAQGFRARLTFPADQVDLRVEVKTSNQIIFEFQSPTKWRKLELTSGESAEI